MCFGKIEKNYLINPTLQVELKVYKNQMHESDKKFICKTYMNYQE